MVEKQPAFMSSWYDTSWKYRRRITINRNQAPETTLENFPLLLTLHESTLRTVDDGGHMAQLHGEDIVFVTEDNSTKLDYAIEYYNPATGWLRAWIRVPKLSHATGMSFYLYYGNLTITAKANPAAVWDANYRLVLRFDPTDELPHDVTRYRNHGVAQIGQEKHLITVPHQNSLDTPAAITVEAWVESEEPRAEVLQALVSKWSLLETFETFAAYDAGNTDQLSTKGFFGAVFDGRYLYFVPQHDGAARHGKVLRYDSHGDFHSTASWRAYDAGHVSSLNTKGYYGAVFDGRYVYFVPRLDGLTHHSRILRYDTHSSFTEDASWMAYDAGNQVSYQGAAFDGRYIYFAPGYEGAYGGPGAEGGPSGKVLRYDCQGDFTDPASYTTYDAGNTSGFNTKCYDGAVFDGRYVYFAPLDAIGLVLRYDTQGTFTAQSSWIAHDAREISGYKMGQCVGVLFDGRYLYYVPYAHGVVVRHDTHGNFTDNISWSAYDASYTSSLQTIGYDGAVFDGRYIYFIPFWDPASDFHANVLRYDTQQTFTSSHAWQAHDAKETDGLKPVGFNGGAFDGRFIYFSPWREQLIDSAGGIASHGRVLRYDTTGANASFSLKYSDYGHNGGLCGAMPGPSFIVNTDQGVRSVGAHLHLSPGLHHLAGVYDGARISLWVDGVLVNEREGVGNIQLSPADITIGRIPDGLGYFAGKILEVRISDIARDEGWLKTQYNNQRTPISFCSAGEEESIRVT